MDPAGADGDEALDDDDDDDEPAKTAVCAFVANNLNTGSNRGSRKPLQKGWKKKGKKDPRRGGDPPLSYREFIRAHPRAVSCVMGGTEHSTMTTGHVPSKEPTRRLTRRCTGRRGVHP